MRACIAALVAVVSVVALAIPALATVMRLVDVGELSSSSDVIVLGSPVAQQSYWERGRILTRTDLAIEEVWSGDVAASGTLPIVTLGGQVGDLGQNVDGEAVLRVGGRVVAFLRRDVLGRYFPRAMWQGIYRVDEDADDPHVAQARPPGVDLVHERALAMPQRLSELKRIVLEARRGHY